jgi:type III secretion protein V
VPFLVMGLAASFAGYSLLRRQEQEEQEALVGAGGPGSVQAIEAGPREPINPESEMFVPVVTPIVLEVSDALVPFVDSKQDNGRFLSELIPLMRDGLFVELGVRFPGVRVRGNSNLPAGAYQIQINEVPVVTGQVILGHVLVNDTPDRLKLIGLTGIPTLNPSSRTSAAWVAAEHRETLEGAGLTAWDPATYLVLHLSAVLRASAREFLGVQEAQTMLDQLEKAFPALVKEVVPKLVSPVKLTEILARLVEEEISIRDLRGVLQALAEHAQVETDGVMLTEHVRASLKRYISHKHARNGNTLVVYLLDPQIEDAVRGAIKHTSAGSHLALEPDLAMEIVQAVKRQCGSLPASAQRPVLLTAMDIRRYVRKLLEHELATAFSVLSYQELSADMNIQPVARIALA